MGTALLFQVGLVLAETPLSADVPIILEGITVVATPIDEEDENTEPMHQTVIQGEALQERFTSIPEILSETVGIKVNRFGGLGDFSAISIRGSSSEQVLVYLDGFLLNNAQGGSVDIAKIPVSQIESITVYRGGAPVGFGQMGIGGLVNIKTKTATREKLLSYQVQYGSFNTSRFNTTFSHKPNKIDFLLGFNLEQSDNDFEFLSDNGTQFTASDDKRVKRENAQFRSFNLISKIAYDLNQKNRLSLYYNYLDTDKGVPGLGAFQSATANFKSVAHRLSLKWDIRDSFRSGIDLQWGLKYTKKNEAFQDLDGEIGVGKQDNDNLTALYEVHLNTEQFIGDHRLKTRFQIREEGFSPDDKLIATSVGTSRQRVYSIGLETQIALFDERLFITPSLLYDDIKDRFEGDPGLSTLGRASPSNKRDQFLTRQIGLLYRFSETVTLRANIGRYFRRPSLFELFGDRGGVLGNPDLAPEKGLNRDIGFRINRHFKGLIRQLTLEAAYFDNIADNLILFIQSSQQTAKPENIASSRVIGQELTARAEIGKHLSFEANYTHQEARNKSDIPNEKNKFLPGRPVNEFFVKTAFYSKHYGLYYSLNFTDENYLDRDNQRNATSRKIHNIGFSFKSLPRWSLSLEAKNLGDNQIEDIFGYPLPGRSYFMTLQGTL